MGSKGLPRSAEKLICPGDAGSYEAQVPETHDRESWNFKISGRKGLGVIARDGR